MDCRLYCLCLTLSLAFAGRATALEPSWHDSLRVLNQQIAQHPGSTDLRLKKAAVNIELGQWDYAAEEYGRVLSLDAHNMAAHYYRAYVYVHLRQYGLARADYERLLAETPLHFEGRLGLVSVLQRLNRLTDSRDELNRLVQMFPDSALAYAARAAFETEQKEYETALYDWDQAIVRDPRNADLVVSKVDVLLALRRTDEARRTLYEAVERGVPRYALREWMEKVGR